VEPSQIDNILWYLSWNCKTKRRRTNLDMREEALLLLLLICIGHSYSDDNEDDARGPGEGKLGQNLGGNVTCGKWTARLVTIGAGDDVSYLWSTDQTQRCTITLKTGLGCNEIALSCSQFFAPNDDPYKCTEGSVLHTKADQTPVRDFCKRQGPDVNFPVLAKNDIKMWYVAERNYTGSFMCEALCSQT